MAAQGTLWKRDGTMAYFYSKAKVWRPMEIRGIEPSSMRTGYKYEIDFDTKSIVRELGPNNYHQENLRAHGLNPHGSNAGTPAEAPQSVQQAPRDPAPEIPLNSLMASATGFAKSAMEGGQCKTWQAAAAAGKAWARMWSPEQARKIGSVDTDAAYAAHEGPDPEPMPSDVDDDLPF